MSISLWTLIALGLTTGCGNGAAPSAPPTAPDDQDRGRTVNTQPSPEPEPQPRAGQADTSPREQGERPPKPRIDPPGTIPDEIEPGERSELTVTAGIHRWSDDPPETLVLERVTQDGRTARVLGELRDDGQPPDRAAGDRIYSAAIELEVAEPGRVYLRARAEHAHAGRVHSEPTSVLVGRPIPRRDRPDAEQILTDPDTGVRVVDRSVLVTVGDAVTPERVEQLAAAVEATVVNRIARFNHYELRIDESGFEALRAALARLERFDEVESASPNPVERSGAEPSP